MMMDPGALSVRSKVNNGSETGISHAACFSEGKEEAEEAEEAEEQIRYLEQAGYWNAAAHLLLPVLHSCHPHNSPTINHHQVSYMYVVIISPSPLAPACRKTW